MTEDICEVVVTAPDGDWLADFTRDLVESRLAAGAHHISVIRSIYRWEGEIYDKPESRVALHTRKSLVQQIVDRANELHPYDVPCVIALPIATGSVEYLRWVLRETSEGPDASEGE